MFIFLYINFIYLNTIYLLYKYIFVNYFNFTKEKYKIKKNKKILMIFFYNFASQTILSNMNPFFF